MTFFQNKCSLFFQVCQRRKLLSSQLMDNAVAVVVIGIAVTVFNSVVVVDLVTDNLDVNRTVAVLLFF